MINPLTIIPRQCTQKDNIFFRNHLDYKQRNTKREKKNDKNQHLDQIPVSACWREFKYFIRLPVDIQKTWLLIKDQVWHKVIFREDIKRISKSLYTFLRLSSTYVHEI